METLNVYKCFISSPGDCKDEREICEKVIQDINNGLAQHLRMKFQTFMWEKDVLPDMGRNGQEIIDDYIEKSEYDIFIGLMKNRFGHPTNKAGSGTEHEFNDALERKSRTNSELKILFFFGKEGVDIDNPKIVEIIEQRKKVKDFKDKIQNNGLYVDFENLVHFENLLREKLELFIKENSPLENPVAKVKEIDLILEQLKLDLEESLKTYNEKSPIWIDPIISSKREVPNNPNKNLDNKIEISSIIDNTTDIIIKAPAEFGLTSLAHYLKLEAWKKGKTFLYLDAKTTKKHKVTGDLKKESTEYYKKNISEVDGIILDSVCFEESGMMSLIKNVCTEFTQIPIIILNTLDNNFFLKSNEDDRVEIKRSFINYYLLPLPKNELRSVVTSYARNKSLPDDSDVILDKVTKDLETLNLHRTVKNCLSVLRASSKIGNEYSPINRTKLLDTIISTTFEDYEIPTYYDKKPDVKDCNFVLGYFCEYLVSKENFEFTESIFKTELKDFCELNFIDLDLSYLLNLLLDNSILTLNKFTQKIYFRNSYWAFYFIAQRMKMDKKFLQKIYSEKRYVDYPEIIEFYTGIDRNREDALTTLNLDLIETLQTVKSKVNIPDTLNPYQSISWKPKIENLQKEEEKISQDVVSSGLPDEVKDKYSDRFYNQIKPYNQVINSVLRDYSFLVLMQQISACSRALRNSDFVDPKIKSELLSNITAAWLEISKLLIALSPILADRGTAFFEGAKFELADDDFMIDDPAEKRKAVLLSLPTNVVRFFKDDLFSIKMGPLIIKKAEQELNSLIKHELMLLIIAERPKNWNKTIDNYIINLDKNSFYLSDVLQVLHYNIDFSATEQVDKRILNLLAKKCRAKHIYQKKNPDLGLINRV